MQYLVSAFGPDKANDPASSEPVLRQMILLDPENPDNYFALANLYEQSGLFEDAEAVMLEVRNLRPDDPIVYLQLAGFYNRSGEFELTIDALEQRARSTRSRPSTGKRRSGTSGLRRIRRPSTSPPASPRRIPQSASTTATSTRSSTRTSCCACRRT